MKCNCKEFKELERFSCYECGSTVGFVYCPFCGKEIEK